MPIPNAKVDFVIGGVQKGGTTALSAFLREHPEICFAGAKETHFFDVDKIYFNDNGEINEAYYHDRFRPLPNHKIAGEATPAYLFFPHIPARVKAYSPEMKWIVLLRNPLNRAYSQYWMEVDRKFENWSFQKALLFEPIRIRMKHKIPERSSLRDHSYATRGLYAKQLLHLWEYFPREQTLVVLSEDMRDHHDDTLKKIHQFLGVHFVRLPQRKAFVGKVHEPMSPLAKSILRRRLRQDVRKLSELLGRDLSGWLK